MTRRNSYCDITRLIATLLFYFFKPTAVKNKKSISVFFGLSSRVRNFYDYCKDGVWRDQRSVWYVSLIKTFNLSVRSYMDKNIQNKAGSLTYTTLLAVVPALALLFAIARGFGFQNIIKTQLFVMFPSQSTMIENSLTFVDKYLETSSGGIFIGVGIIFLLWSLISMLRNVELTFNHIWGVKKGRTPYRMITDYTTIIIVLPIIMICSAGISLFMSSVVKNAVGYTIISPIVEMVLDYAPFFLTWLFFAGMYTLIPYTKVKFRYALISGFICTLMFRLVQYMFVSGQIYVTKYNAIYGSFSFLPLFMIWLYLTWLIIIAGVVITYSAQNIFRFNYFNQIKNISQRYSDELAIYTFLIISSRFDNGEPPLSKYSLMKKYNLPIQLLNIIIDRLEDAGFISVVHAENDTLAYQPARNFTEMTFRQFMEKYREVGDSDFIGELKRNPILSKISKLVKSDDENQDIKLSDIYKNKLFEN